MLVVVPVVEDLLLVLLHLPACLLEHLFPLLAPHQEVLLLVLVAVLLPLQRLPLVLAVVHLLVLEGLLLLALVHEWAVHLPLDLKAEALVLLLPVQEVLPELLPHDLEVLLLLALARTTNSILVSTSSVLSYF